MKRSGFSLVELVLSIVIIAIALMTVPLMLGQGAKSNQHALIQESILASRTKMGNILSFPWDNNISDGGVFDVYRVIDVESGDGNLSRVTTGTGLRRKGHVKEHGRRRMLQIARNATAIGVDGAEGAFNDIDDFNGDISMVAPTLVNGAIGVEGEYDYLDRGLRLHTEVRFINDDANYSAQTILFDFNTTASQAFTVANRSTNIKMITIEANSTNRDTPFRFRTFSSNIGQSRLYKAVK